MLPSWRRRLRPATTGRRGLRAPRHGAPREGLDAPRQIGVRIVGAAAHEIPDQRQDDHGVGLVDASDEGVGRSRELEHEQPPSRSHDPAQLTQPRIEIFEVPHSERDRRDVERVVALNDVTTPTALGYIDHRLKQMGVHKMLNRAGVSEGDIVWIGEFSFEYQPDL